MFFDFIPTFLFSLNSFYFILNWSFFFQFLILYVLYNIYTSTSVFYTIFYTLFQISILGVILTYNSMDLFTAFLFLSESVIMFISILLVFYLNVYSNTSTLIKPYYFNKFGGFVLLILFNCYYSFYSQCEYFLYLNFDTNVFYDDFYLNSNSNLFNDLYALYINFFFLNNFSFILVVLLLLVASLICVNLNLSLKSNKILNYNNFFLLFDFFKDFTKFIFMRKQTLTDQLNTLGSTRFFKKKAN